MIRNNGRLVRASWDDALDAAANGFKKAIAAGGPDAVAFYGSGQLFTQESYTANKLFKAGIGTNNVDGNPRLCMASAAAGYTSVFGADEPSGCYDDIDHATLFFVIGANMAECHPVVWERVMDRKRTHPQTRIIAVDPRRTPTTQHADQHLQLRPGTDVALLNAMCYELIRTGLIDKPFIEQYLTYRRGAPDTPPLTWDDFVGHLQQYAPEQVAELCGLGAAEIREAAQWFGTAESALSFWTMGLNQQSNGTGANRMMMALHLITGQMGRAGTGGIFPYRSAQRRRRGAGRGSACPHPSRGPPGAQSRAPRADGTALGCAAGAHLAQPGLRRRQPVQGDAGWERACSAGDVHQPGTLAPLRGQVSPRDGARVFGGCRRDIPHSHRSARGCLLSSSDVGGKGGGVFQLRASLPSRGKAGGPAWRSPW
jgi:anaerobic selenocysteine-containing dehydrogenase